MILQALNSYYDRLLADPDEDVAEPGFSKSKIHFALVLGPDGSLRAVDDLRIKAEKGNKMFPRELRVPEAFKRTVGVASYFLWDNTGYALGMDDKGKPDRVVKQFEAFKALAHEIGDTLDDPGMRAVLAFLDAWKPENAPDLDHWDEMIGQNMVFRLDGETRYVHDSPAVKNAWLARQKTTDSGGAGFCLVSCELGPVARLHPAIKGVQGAQTTGAALVSFNLDAFTSYGREQNFNAPVSERAAFGYATALNHMLGGRRQKVRIADATTVFWTEKPTEAEAAFAGLFEVEEDEKKEAHDPVLIGKLREVVEAVRDGSRPDAWKEDQQTRFFILGLSPNAARLSVRFWHVSDVGTMLTRLGQHYADLEIERRYPGDPTFPSPWRLLLEVAPQRKSENIPPTLGGELTRAILTGGDYPRSLLSRVITRIRADGEVTTLRAALIKAHYARAMRRGRNFTTITASEVVVSLNPDSTNPGYRLGRLFAALEKAQQDALPGINATIRDRFYGAASATPRGVFPRLLRLAQHHIAKAEHGYASDRRIAEIAEGIDAFPAHLDLDGQAMFALGYYHQRNALYRKKEAAAPSSGAE